MATDELDLIALRRPCFVTIPLTGRRVALRFFRAEEKKQYSAWLADPNNATLLVGLLRAAIPDITDEELDDLSLDEDVPRIVVKANGKAVMLETVLKNGLSDGAPQPPSPTLPSTPTTKSPSSSPASGKPTASGRRSSSKSSGTKSSSPSTD